MKKYPKMLIQMKERKDYEVLSRIVESTINNLEDGVFAFNKEEMRIFTFDGNGQLIFDSDK